MAHLLLPKEKHLVAAGDLACGCAIRPEQISWQCMHGEAQQGSAGSAAIGSQLLHILCRALMASFSLLEGHQACRLEHAFWLLKYVEIADHTAFTDLVERAKELGSLAELSLLQAGF